MTDVTRPGGFRKTTPRTATAASANRIKPFFVRVPTVKWVGSTGVRVCRRCSLGYALHMDRFAKTARARKLLVASVGVAAISYVACSTETSGNLMAPYDSDAGSRRRHRRRQADAPPTSGNLMPPPPADAAADATDASDAGADTGVPPTSGNLMPPPPASASDGS